MFLSALYSLYVYKKKCMVIMCWGQFLFLMFSSVYGLKVIPTLPEENISGVAIVKSSSKKIVKLYKVIATYYY